MCRVRPRSAPSYDTVIAALQEVDQTMDINLKAFPHEGLAEDVVCGHWGKPRSPHSKGRVL